MADPHDLEAGDTCYYNDQECEVVRGYNGLNMRIQEPGADVQTIIDPRGVTHPDDYEPPEPEPDVEEEAVQELEESTDTEDDDDDGADGVSEEGEDDEDDKEPESEEDESDDEGEYVCEDCGQSFDSPQALAGHSSQHSDDEE